MTLDRLIVLRILAVGALSILVACGGGGKAPAGEDAPERPADTSAAAASDAQRPARTLPIPGSAAPSPENPHAAPVELTWTTPPGWVEEPPKSSMRLAQYRVPGPAGDGECVVFYFGPGQGGDAASNATRWANQFEQPDGRPSVEALQMSELEGTRVPVQMVEITGTYDGGMTMTDAPAQKQPGAMLLGGIAEGPAGPWFFKFTGPEATVRAQREAFVAMMQTVGAAEP